MNILYMNQGVNGDWGAVKYSDYDVICLAESNHVKTGFEIAWESADSSPTMSIQKKSGKRILSAPKDLDPTCQAVRPMVLFSLTNSPVHVVFVHLKSGNMAQATDAFTIAVQGALRALQAADKQVIWVGDFNRANATPLDDAFAYVECLHEGGGNSAWNLDRVYISGPWKTKPTVKVVAVSSADHGHEGLAISF